MASPIPLNRIESVLRQGAGDLDQLHRRAQRGYHRGKDLAAELDEVLAPRRA